MLSHMEAFRGIPPVSAPSLSVSQVQDEETQDKIRQPVSKAIHQNRLKMVRCPILVPAEGSLSTHTVMLLVVRLSDLEEVTRLS